MKRCDEFKTMRREWVVTTSLAISFAFGSLGCGAAKEVTNTLLAGSCSIVASGFTTCIDYTGAGYTGVSAQSACSSSNSGSTTGTYSASACASAGRVGSCKVSSGQATEQTVRYMTGYSDTTAQAACSGLSGTYTAG